MNELCSFYLPSLSLYLEGELKDCALSERIRRHLLVCPDCRDEAERHQELSDSILAAFHREFSPRNGGAPPPLLESSEEAAAAGRTDRILAAIRRRAARRRQVSRRRIAAALLAAAVVGAAALIDLRQSRQDPAAGTPVAEAKRTAAPSNADRGVEMIRWLLDGEPLPEVSSPRQAAAAGGPGEARLFGVAHRVLPREDGTWVELPGAGGLPVRWVLWVRLREPYRDPLGGGWTYLVQDAVEASAGPAGPVRPDAVIPVRRMALHRPREVESIPRTLWRRERGANVYRLLVVPDPGEPLDPPASQLPGGEPVIPRRLLSDLESPFQRY